MHLKKLISGLFVSLLLVNLTFADTSTSYTIDLSELNSGGTLLSSSSFEVNSAFSGFTEGNFLNSTSYGSGSGLIYLEQWCGNSILEFGETCDDGNTTSLDGCSSNCLLENVCGNGLVEGGETCDDANTTNGDGCSSICSIETGYGCTGAPSSCTPICGDGLILGLEQCDDSNTTSGDGCSNICITEFCSDGVVQAGLGEQCDDGNIVNNDGCSSTCQTEVTQICGNGVLEGGEQCDDGNTTNGDGCNACCGIEISPPPSGGGGGGGIVLSVCGNNKKEGLEQCDDGNKISGDGCSKFCRTEAIVVGKTLNIKARPGNRVNPTANWGTTAYLRFYHHGQAKVVHTETITISNTGWGQLTIPDLPDGIYDVSIKALSHLTKPIRNIEISGNNEFLLDFTFGETFFLVPGDVHESKDNFVNALDITAVVKALYSADVHADLNKDGIVNALDISITVNNLYKTGE